MLCTYAMHPCHVSMLCVYATCQCYVPMLCAYATPGTVAAHGAISLRALSGTELAHAPLSSYGTELACTPLSAYARASRCPAPTHLRTRVAPPPMLLPPAMLLRSCYAMSGTDVAYGPTRARSEGTGIGLRASYGCLERVHQASRTETAYLCTRIGQICTENWVELYQGSCTET
eukprot:2021771-Rhodomonas_salina.1